MSVRQLTSIKTVFLLNVRILFFVLFLIIFGYLKEDHKFLPEYLTLSLTVMLDIDKEQVHNNKQLKNNLFCFNLFLNLINYNV